MKTRTYVYRNIVFNKGKYASVVLLIAISVATIFTLSIITEQLNSAVRSVFLLNKNSLFVSEKNTYFGNLLPTTSRVNESFSTEIEQIPGVVLAFNIIFKNYFVNLSTSFIQNYVTGINTENLGVFTQNMKFKEGRMFSAVHEAIVGASFSEGKAKIGDIIMIQNESFVITGIFSNRNLFLDSLVFIDFEKAQSLFDMEGYCTAVYVFVDDSVSCAEIRNQIEALLPMVEVIDETKIRVLLGGFLEFFDVAKYVLTVIPLFVTVIALYSIYLFIFESRVKEYAILKSMGISSERMIALNIFESISIGLAGFSFGYFCGWLLFWLSYTSAFNIKMEFLVSAAYYFNYLSLESISITLILVLLSATLSWIFPFKRLMRKNLIEHLRN